MWGPVQLLNWFFFGCSVWNNEHFQTFLIISYYVYLSSMCKVPVRLSTSCGLLYHTSSGWISLAFGQDPVHSDGHLSLAWYDLWHHHLLLLSFTPIWYCFCLSQSTCRFHYLCLELSPTWSSPPCRFTPILPFCAPQAELIGPNHAQPFPMGLLIASQGVARTWVRSHLNGSGDLGIICGHMAVRETLWQCHSFNQRYSE